MPAFTFGPWVARPEQNQLESPDGAVRLEPKVMALLTLLVERAPGVVSTDEILERVWTDVYVVDSVVYRAISVLRKTLNDDSKAPEYIESVPRVGYRFIKTVATPDQLNGSGVLGAINLLLVHSPKSEWLVNLSQGVAKHLRWGSESLRVFVSGREADCAYRLAVTAESDRVANWQLLYDPTNELIWSDSVERQDLAEKDQRLSEAIAQSVIERIYRNQTRRLAMLVVPDRERSYWDLILLSDRFRSTASADLKQRRHRLLRAIEMFPQLAPAYAAWADYCSWTVINGLAADPAELAQTAKLAADTAVDLEPDSPPGLSRSGTVYARLGDFERGIELCRRSVELAPSSTTREALARVLCFAGQSEESVAIYERILGSQPSGQVFQYGKLVVPLVQQGEFERAETYSRLSVINFPKDFYGWALRSNLLAQLGRLEEARTAWHEVATLRPDLKIEDLILGTERTYGRSVSQRRRLTQGYLSLQKLL